MFRRPVAVAAAVTPLLLACGGGDDAPATAPSVTFVEPDSADGTPPEQLALPLTSLLRWSRSDDRLIHTAAVEVTAACMGERGFDFPPYRDEAFGHYPLPHPFGPWDIDDITDGYGPSVIHNPPTILEEFMAGLPPETAASWGVAYNGTDPFGGRRPTVTLPDGSEVESGFADGAREGCSFQGFDAVYGDYAEREELRQEIEELANEAAVDADGNDLVDQALDAWRDCMEAEGIDVDGGADGPSDLSLHYISEPGVSDEEQRVAAQDLRCKAESNLHDAYFAARAEAENEVIEENQTYIEAWREVKEASLERAREIVAGDG